MNNLAMSNRHRTIIGSTIIISILMIIDSSVISIYLSISDIPSPHLNLAFFIIFLIGFVCSNFLFLWYAKSNELAGVKKSIRKIISASFLMYFIQGSITLLFVYIVGSLLYNGYYPKDLVYLVVYIAYISTISFLILLVYKFLKWFFLNKNNYILAYGIAFLLILAMIIISFAYINMKLTYSGTLVHLGSINANIGNYSNFGANLSSLGSTYTIMSIVSFISIWIPSVLLLRTYSLRIGKLTYWLLVSIPLVIFLAPHILNEFGLLTNLFLEYGKSFTLLYYIIFSPYKQIGGLLFGIVFWVAATRINRGYLRTLVNTAGIGFVLLFGSSVLHGLTYIVAPPFGLITISYMSLASYLLVNGIFRSTKELSQDGAIRQEIYKIAEKQLDLLRNISMADLVTRSEHIVKTAKSRVEINEPLALEVTDESDYKKFLNEILEELSAKKMTNNFDNK